MRGTCLELVKTHVPHCLWSTQVLEATKIQISPCSPALQPTSSFLFLSLPLLQRAQRLLSGCNQSLFCARSNLIGPLFSPKEKIQIFAPRGRRRKDTRGSQRTLISSHHCRAMTNVPLLICDKWWRALGFKM